MKEISGGHHHHGKKDKEEGRELAFVRVIKGERRDKGSGRTGERSSRPILPSYSGKVE